MHKRALCRHAVSVCPSVTFVDHVKTDKRIFEIFSPSGSDTILVFPHQTGWRYSDVTPLTEASNAGGVGKKTRFRTNNWTCVYCCLQHIYRVTLIGVFFGHFRINLHQTRTQYSNVYDTLTEIRRQKPVYQKTGTGFWRIWHAIWYRIFLVSVSGNE